MNKDDMKTRMLELDSLATLRFPGKTFQCIIVGGGALLSLGLKAKGTLDVDVLVAPRQLSDLFDQFDFNTKVQSLSICFPFHYLDRIRKIEIGTKTIEFYTLSVEDLIVSKLYAYRKKDVEDLEDIIKSGQYDKTLLAQVVADAKASALNDRAYHEMICLYNQHFLLG
jgi:hypothetical protein